MSHLQLTVASGDELSVRRFSAAESTSALFTVSVWVRAANPEIDLEAIVGKEASLHVVQGARFTLGMGSRTWKGVCAYAEQVQAEPTGLSTYYLRIVPRLWLLTQRQNYRIFQHLSIPDIADQLLAEWSIEPEWHIDRGQYPKLEYKVQYGESDYAFLCRLLEEAGIAFTFADDEAQRAPCSPSATRSQTAARARRAAALRRQPQPGRPRTSSSPTSASRTRCARARTPCATTTFATLASRSSARRPRRRRPRTATSSTTTGRAPSSSRAASRRRHARRRRRGRRAATSRGSARTRRRALPRPAGAPASAASPSRPTRRPVRPARCFTIDHHPHAELGEGQRLLVIEHEHRGHARRASGTVGRARSSPRSPTARRSDAQARR